MNHKHFKEISSTQSFIREYKDLDDKDLLVSCDKQNSGHGQYSRTWDQYEGGLCFSFTLMPCEILTLSSLEIGILICHYFQSKYDTELKLKWPNDIMTETGKKCGGIIINNAINSKNIIVGVGLNLLPSNFDQSYKTTAGHILSSSTNLNNQTLSLDIYNYILNNRILSNQITHIWTKLCVHMNQPLTIKDEDSHSGIFKGVGKVGEAQILINNSVESFYTGSLTLKENS